MAQSAICRSLTAELKTAGRGAPSASVRKVQQAISRQTAELRKVKAQMNQARCGFGLFSGQNAQCSMLRSTVGSMENNLWKLKQQLSGSASTRKTRSRATILAAMRQNRCGEKATVRTASAPANAGRNVSASRVTAKNPNKSEGRPSNVYRTLCVRTCDGYYFPISFSVSKDMFARDAKTCEARCPGSEAELYAHDVVNEESEAMVSVASGTPYAELPTAFKYRSRKGIDRASCSCRASKNFKIVAGTAKKPVETAENSIAKTDETTKVAHNQEMPASQSGTSFYVPAEPASLDAGKAEPAVNAIDNVVETDDAPKATETAGVSEPRRVRLVGPEFLPDPEGAIDLKAPAPTPAP